MKRRKSRNIKTTREVRRVTTKPNFIVIGLAILMVWLFVYQSGNIELGLGYLTPPRLFDITIVGLGIINLFTSHPVTKATLLVLIVIAIYPK